MLVLPERSTAAVQQSASPQATRAEPAKSLRQLPLFFHSLQAEMALAAVTPLRIGASPRLAAGPSSRRATLAVRASAKTAVEEKPAAAQEVAQPAAASEQAAAPAAAAPAASAAPAAAKPSGSGVVVRPHGVRKESPYADILEVMSPSGPAPELVNGRLAMIGFVAGVGCELFTQQPILAQVRVAFCLLLGGIGHAGTAGGWAACSPRSHESMGHNVSLLWPAPLDRGLAVCGQSLAFSRLGCTWPANRTANPLLSPPDGRRWALASSPSGGPPTCSSPPPWCTCSASMTTTRPSGEAPPEA